MPEHIRQNFKDERVRAAELLIDVILDGGLRVEPRYQRDDVGYRQQHSVDLRVLVYTPGSEHGQTLRPNRSSPMNIKALGTAVSPR